MSNPNNAVETSTDVSSEGLVFSTDYYLKTLSIITSDGQVVDIKGLAVEINLYEDIFSPCMSGSILMGDALDLIANLKIHGHEWIQLEIDKPSLSNSIKKVFRIYKISEREYSSASMQNYVIHFCSEELILSTQRYMSKSYKGMIVSDMVNDILKNQLGVGDSKMKGTFDKTEGNFNLIIPRMQPLEAIEWLTTRSYSSKGTLFMFFENRDGFNFVSYETLIKTPTYQTYFKNPKLNTTAQKNVNSVNYLKIVQDFDLIASGRYGAYSSSLMTYDFINRKLGTKSINAKQFDLLNDNIPVNDTTNRFNKPIHAHQDYLLKFYPTTDADPLTNSSHPENWLQQKASKLAQLHSFKMVISIPGDVLMKVGRVIEVELPKAMPLDASGKQINDMRTGKYLVSAVHHIFINDVMSTVCELLSDSVSGQLNPSIDTSPSLQAVKRA